MHRILGAVADGEPKVIWVKMINRHAEYDKVLSIRTRFNNILEELIVDRRYHHVMDVNAALDHANCFSPRNRLSPEGETRFWREIDQQIERFEYKKISLKPIRYELNSTKKGGNTSSFAHYNKAKGRGK